MSHRSNAIGNIFKGQHLGLNAVAPRPISLLVLVLTLVLLITNGGAG